MAVNRVTMKEGNIGSFGRQRRQGDSALAQSIRTEMERVLPNGWNPADINLTTILSYISTGTYEFGDTTVILYKGDGSRAYTSDMKLSSEYLFTIDGTHTYTGAFFLKERAAGVAEAAEAVAGVDPWQQRLSEQLGVAAWALEDVVEPLRRLTNARIEAARNVREADLVEEGVARLVARAVVSELAGFEAASEEPQHQRRRVA